MMSSHYRLIALVAAVPLVCVPAHAQTTKLTITLSGRDRVVRNRVRYACDANATKLKLPSDQFTVEYLNGGGNRLAIVPIEGKRLIFSQVVSGSGERYAAQWYEWWDKGSEAGLTSLHVGPDDKQPATFCHELK